MITILQESIVLSDYCAVNAVFFFYFISRSKVTAIHMLLSTIQSKSTPTDNELEFTTVTAVMLSLIERNLYNSNVKGSAKNNESN